MKKRPHIPFSPLNTYQIMGTFCCSTLQREFNSRKFTKHFHCFDARSMIEANLIVLWGSFTPKLLTLIAKRIPLMPENYCFIHIRGCSHRVDNQFSLSSISNFISANLIFSNCEITSADYKKLLKESRACLKV